MTLFENQKSRAGECRHLCGTCTAPANTVDELVRKHEKDGGLHPGCRAKGGECAALLSNKPNPAEPPVIPLPDSPPASLPHCRSILSLSLMILLLRLLRSKTSLMSWPLLREGCAATLRLRVAS